jgi:hypothetical protein
MASMSKLNSSRIKCQRIEGEPRLNLGFKSTCGCFEVCMRELKCNLSSSLLDYVLQCSTSLEYRAR